MEIAAAKTEEAEDAEVEAEAKVTRKKTGTEISDQWQQWQFRNVCCCQGEACDEASNEIWTPSR